MDAEVMVPPRPNISAAPAMDFYSLNFPPKWVSQETIQCIAREAAGKILIAESKAVRCQQDLAATKEEAVKMLVRMKQMMDSKMAETEKESLAQIRRIMELEYQLMEAEDIIVSLRTELSKVLGNFDRRKDELETSDEHIPKESAAVLQDAYNQKNFISTSPHPEPFACADKAMDINSKITSGSLQHGNNSRLFRVEKVTSMKNFDPQNPDLASILVRNKETESCRNGCTERIHAFENSSLSEHWPNPGSSNHGPSFLKNGYDVINAVEGPSAISYAMCKQENMTKNGSLTWPKEMINAGGRIDARYADMSSSIPSSRSKKNVCQEIKFDNRNLPDQLLVSGSHTTKYLPQTMAGVTSNTSTPGENNLTDDVEKSDNDSKHHLQPIESDKESPKECEENMVLSCNNKCTAGSTNEVEFNQSDILNVSAGNSDSEYPVKEVNTVHGHTSGCPPVGSHGSEPGDGASILASNMDSKKECVRHEDVGEPCILPSTKAIHNGDQGQEVINIINPIKHDSGVPNGLGANPVDQSTTGSQALQNSNMEEAHRKSVTTSLQTVNDKFLKYTFHRKRKREVIANKTEEVVVEKKPCSKKRSARRRRILHKLPEFGKVMESSRDSRRLMQVARQLISLSEMRW